MNATVGDRLHIKGRGAGLGKQSGEIIEVRGPNGEPPYLVRFADGHETLVYPGPDCVIESGAPGN
ncbi:DUF1918 domain-containing protein [Streptomyces sp. NPDC056337]|uniref:DUF1918 domain-containing protein n=1 Tax=Streptomyces sp. NPDC056337 TaxID=3345787 RepID=UPI0035D9A065